MRKAQGVTQEQADITACQLCQIKIQGQQWDGPEAASLNTSVPLQPSLWAWGAFQPTSPFYSLFSCIYLKTGNAKLNFPVLGLYMYVSSWGQLFLPIAAFTKYLLFQTRLKSFVFSLDNTKQAAKDYVHSLCSLSQDSSYLSAITHSGYSDAAVKIPQWRLKERKAIWPYTAHKSVCCSDSRRKNCISQTKCYWVVIFRIELWYSNFFKN